VPRAPLGEIELEYEILGPEDGTPLLLIGGLGSQLISWDDQFCTELASRGYRVIRYDNRDSGLSTSLDELGVPDLLALLVGGSAEAPYLLDAMADDAVALLGHLGIRRAHLIGLSLGGMVAQLIALAHPTMVLSVVAALSGPPGRPDSLPSPEVARELLRPPGVTFAERVVAAVALRQVLAAQDGAFDVELARRRAETPIRRAHGPAGTMRQAAAVLATPNHLQELWRLEVPVMLVHGELDPLIPFESARAAALAIPACKLVAVPGLGHDLPPNVALQLINRIAEFHDGVSDPKD
jgi:pimeloyl-ACP methyl ester carboxylesterase